MRPINVAFFIVAMAASAFAFSATPPQAPSIAQLAAYPHFSGFTLAPDGKHIAALRGTGEERVIAVWSTDALDQPPTLIGAERMKILSVSFIKNDRLAVSFWQPYDLRSSRIIKTFINKLMITDLQGKQWNEPLPLTRTASRSEQLAQARISPTILDTLPNDPHHILVVNNVGSDSGDVFRVDLRDFTSTRVQMSQEHVSGYVVDHDGTLRARLRQNVDGKGAYISVEFRDPQSDAWDEHFRSYVKDRDQTVIAGFSSDPNIAYLLTNQGRDKTVLYAYDIAKREKTEVLFSHEFFNANGVLTNPYRSAGEDFGSLLGIGYAGPRGDDIIWVSPRWKALDAGLRLALGIKDQPVTFIDPATGKSNTTDYPTEKNYWISAFTPDMSTLIIGVDGAATPPEYYLFRNGHLTLLAKSYPDFDSRAFGNTQLVYYKARDGLQIPAFLTKPNPELCGPGPWPAVVHPHGGPWARDNMRFDSSMWVPLMVSRCMAVLRPQFRGSDGWGRKLWMAGDAEWGKKMQDDNDDGAKWLVDQGIASPGRIGIFGFSYGGYSAFVAGIRPAGTYKCAIAGAGVSDIRKIWSRFYTNPFFRQAQAPTVAGVSPVDAAASLQIPMMVFHGERDQTVPIEQSQWFVDGAKTAAAPIVFHRIDDYAHGPAWTRKTMAQQLGFIEDYLQHGCGGSGL